MANKKHFTPLFWRSLFTRATALTLAFALMSLSGCTPKAPVETYEQHSASQEPSSSEPTPGTEQESTPQDPDPAVAEAFDAFLDREFREEVVLNTINLHFSLSDPAAYGITDYEVTFGDASLEALEESARDTKALLQEMSAFDYDALRPDQQLTYDMLVDYLETALEAEPYFLYTSSFNPTTGVQSQLPILMAEYTFRSERDVQDYLALLAQMPDYYQQLLDFEQLKSTNGLFMSDRAVDDIAASCQAFLADQETHYLLTTFDERLAALPDLTEDARADYRAQNQRIFTKQIVPAYQTIIDRLTALKGTGRYAGGLCQYPDGKAYYEYLIKMGTGTRHTIDELNQLIRGRITTQAMEMSYLLEYAPLSDEELNNFAFTMTEPTAILEHLRAQIAADFPAIPDTTYTIKTVPESLEGTLSPAFYLTPPLDAPLDNVIYINNGQLNETTLFSTLAHEGYPGHLYQTVYAATLDRPALYALIGCSGYTEGWATYVEEYSYGLDTGLNKSLARIMALNNSVTLGVYAMADIGINYEGWSLIDTATFLEQWFGGVDQATLETFYYTMVEDPGNYLNYYVGYLEILLLLDEADDTLGRNFVLKDFHKFILDMSDCSFRVIDKYFDRWLEENGAQ